MDKEFLKRLKTNLYSENSLLETARYLADFNYEEIKEFPCMSLDESLRIIGNILKKIDIDYYELFNKMYNEQDCNNPVIYTLTSKEDLANNESNTFNQEVYFYKTNTIADVYLLIHEFSHMLVNRNGSYKYDINKKRNDELIPILSECIVSKLIKDKEYIKLRINKTIFYAKSILAKEEIKKGNYNIEKLFNKYKFTKKDIEFFKNDLLYNKSLNYEEEKRYVYGFIYAYYYSLNNPIENYKYLIKQYTDNRNILLPSVNIERILTKRHI